VLKLACQIPDQHVSVTSFQHSKIVLENENETGTGIAVITAKWHHHPPCL
jgi:hypothetical protein